MFVMVSASDNPWVVALLLLVQVVIPLLQSSAGSESSYALNIAALFLLGLSALTLLKLFRFGRVLYQLRGRHPEMSWGSFFREAYRQVAAAAAQRDAGAANARAQAAGASGGDRFGRITRVIQVMPTEEFKTPAELQNANTHELKERLRRREVDFSGCVERSELVELLVRFRGGPSNNDTCCICCEEYQSGDALRLLRKCKHEFHLECLDKWAFTSVSTERAPSCPLCNQALE